METAILVIGWIGLVGALIWTVVVLKLVSSVLRTLKSVLELAVFIRTASRGVSSHTEAVSSLAELESPGRRVRESSAELLTLTRSIEQKLERLTEARSTR